MNKRKCKKWYGKLKKLREKHAEFRQAYADALKFAEENPGVRETAFGGCRGLFGEIKGLVLALKKEFAFIKYENFVNRLIQNKRLREKLLEIVSDENYDEAVATAKELDPSVKVPKREEIIKNVLALGREKLKKIATIMGKPGLIIVPDKSLVEMKDAMDANRHYDKQDEDDDEEYYFDDYTWSEKPGKVSVSILDMVQYPGVVPGQKPSEQSSEEQLRICEKYFRDNGMRLNSDRQYAAGLQKSLRVYEKAKKNGEINPEKYILDLSRLDQTQDQSTLTFINQEHNSAISDVTYAQFLVDWVAFSADDADAYALDLRGRGAVQVMEI
jgi:hypothetical protein